uniref:hypothetical protein n=1 Tax=Salmonella enterica TaxID=28901 RepID=UPI0035238540
LLSSFTPKHENTNGPSPTRHPLREQRKRLLNWDPNTLALPTNRSKRETFWELVVNYAGLATKENIDLLTTNEHILADNEKKMEKQIETVMTKTNAIVTSFTEQAAKLSELYH